MEILIVGVLLVALMAYVSTRIKGAANKAYAREDFETEDFRITKPDDFIIPIKEDSEFAFEAYSKEYAEEFPSEAFRQCWATVSAEDLTVRKPGVEDFDKVENNTTLNCIRKILVNTDIKKCFILEINTVSDYEEKYKTSIGAFLESFCLK